MSGHHEQVQRVHSDGVAATAHPPWPLVHGLGPRGNLFTFHIIVCWSSPGTIVLIVYDSKARDVTASGTSEVYNRVGGFSSAVKLRGVVFSLTLGFPQMSRGLQKAQYTPGLPYDHEVKLPLLSSPYLSLGHFFLREAFLCKLAGKMGGRWWSQIKETAKKHGRFTILYIHSEP